jgi:hypothetical protein
LKESIEDMKYSIDMCLVCRTYEHMERKLNVLWEEFKKVDLEISPSNTEKVRVNRIVKGDLKLNVKYIKTSLDFCCFGSAVRSQSRCQCENTEG